MAETLVKTAALPYNYRKNVFPVVGVRMAEDDEGMHDMWQPGEQDMALLSAKLKIPAPRRGYIVRRELFDMLARGWIFGVTYIKGAAGMGKTTLVSSFLRENGVENAAWLSLDTDDDDPLIFWHRFAVAAAALPGARMESLMALFRSGGTPLQAEELAARVRAAVSDVEPCVVVLDDMHLLQDGAVLRSFERFLQDFPENLHLFLLSREDPAFYTGGLAVAGKLLFIDGEALRLSEEESVRFLRDTLGLEADDDRVAWLTGQADGWIGGLQLLAAADGMGAGSTRTGQVLTADYLTREIFATLTAEEQQFLTVTAILPYFDVALCTALLGEGSHAQTIERLIAKNLFLTCVNEDAGIYRYHSILWEYLKRRFEAIPQTEQLALHRRAATALCERGERVAALPHLIAAGEFARAGQLLGVMGDCAESWHYINRLPLDIVRADTNLAVQSIVYNLLIHPDIHRAKQSYSALKTSNEGHPFLRAWQQIGVYMGESVDFNHPPMPVLPEQIDAAGMNPVVQALAYAGSASLFLEREDYENSAKFADRAYEIGGGDNPFVDYYLLSSRAQLAEETGELNESLRFFEKMQEAVTRSPTVGLLKIFHAVGRTGVYLKRMEREPAAAALDEADRGLKQYPNFSYLMTFGYAYNRIEYDIIFDSVDAALPDLEKLLDRSSRDMRTILVCDRLILHPVVQNRLPEAWAERFLQECGALGGQVSLMSQLVGARLRWQRGELDAAIQTVEQVLSYSRAHQNRLMLVSAGLLRAGMLLQSGGETRIIQNLLREAIHYAWENRILLPFFVERFVLADVFAAFPIRELPESEQLFLRDVRALCAPAPLGGNVLSEREQEVLRELARGLTNPQIAEQLCISLATVKTHLLNMYGKLGVSTRVQAVEEARKRKLWS
ncbi:MAG: LuxR C-terminal-related transcriptional regulator [Ethanoligenens sp.]